MKLWILSECLTSLIAVILNYPKVKKRRVALARILALKSEIILLDEPTTSLDQESERLIEGLILRINREQGTTIIMVSHDNQQAMALSTRILPLLEGKIAAEPFHSRSEYVHG